MSKEVYWAPLSDRACCPCCDARTRLAYEIMTDEYTCYHCGLVGTVNEFRVHFQNLERSEKGLPLVDETEQVKYANMRAWGLTTV